jgi:hypothetical protein
MLKRIFIKFPISSTPTYYEGLHEAQVRLNRFSKIQLTVQQIKNNMNYRPY